MIFKFDYNSQTSIAVSTVFVGATWIETVLRCTKTEESTHDDDDDGSRFNFQKNFCFALL